MIQFHSDVDIFSFMIQSLTGNPNTVRTKSVINPRYLLALTKLDKITNKKLAEYLGITSVTAWKITRKCVAHGILKGSETPARKIPVVYTITQYGKTYIGCNCNG